MAKTTKSKALVPAGQRKTSVMRKAATVAVAPATDGTLLPILGSDLALAKLIGDGGDVMREGGVVLVTGRAYATRAGVVRDEMSKTWPSVTFSGRIMCARISFTISPIAAACPAGISNANNVKPFTRRSRPSSQIDTMSAFCPGLKPRRIMSASLTNNTSR